MEKTNTKEQILEAALHLFSIKGYESTSISQIAEAVGLRKASLYSHYASKQDILDNLMAMLIDEYEKHSLFVNANWDDPEFTKSKADMSDEDIIAMIKGQIRYVIHDPRISEVRKMLTIEQFQNSTLKQYQDRFSYEDIKRYNVGLIKFLCKSGRLKDEDPEIMAAQLAWPISMWTYMCDRDIEREAEAMDLIERHIRQFLRVYGV